MGNDLTRKQAAIMGHIADGMKITDIAAQTGMAVSTVNTHLERSKRKLGAKTTTQAAVLFDRLKRAMA
jgi:DNA-binding NarL/FixJ family response regulator